MCTRLQKQYHVAHGEIGPLIQQCDAGFKYAIGLLASSTTASDTIIMVTHLSMGARSVYARRLCPNTIRSNSRHCHLVKTNSNFAAIKKSLQNLTN